jgi:hypothetical protein
VVSIILLVVVIVSVCGGDSASNSAGGDVAEGLVQAVGVEPAQVFDDGELELVGGAPDAVGDQFGLEAVDKALGERVVAGVTDRPDRGQHPVVGERLGVVDRGVLAAAIGVVDKFDVGAAAALMQRHPQRVQHDVVRMWPASCQPTIPRLKASRMNAKNTTPSQHLR